MARSLKYGVLVVLVSSLIAAIWVGASFLSAMNRFFAEDAISHTGQTIVSAIAAYEKEYGFAPDRLDELAPKFVEVIPTVPEIDSIEYKQDTEGVAWTLKINCSVSGRSRIFLYRSDSSLTEQERLDSIGSIHGFTVLSADG